MCGVKNFWGRDVGICRAWLAYWPYVYLTEASKVEVLFFTAYLFSKFEFEWTETNLMIGLISIGWMAIERWLLARSQSNALSFIGNYEQSKTHWQKSRLWLLASLAGNWSADIAWQKMACTTKGTFTVTTEAGNALHRWLFFCVAFLSKRDENDTCFVYINHIQFICFHLDFDANISLQNLGGFHWCVSRAKCRFS